MPQVRFDMETGLRPDQVIALLTDFTERRPDLWPGLWSGAYNVYSVGETTAEVREGNKSPKVWARERYDWSIPGTVRWEVIESNFCKPGGFVKVEVAPRQGDGSVLHVSWSRSPTGLMGVVATTMIKLTGGAPVKQSLAAGLRRAEARSTERAE
jgi:hypothetical protein